MSFGGGTALIPSFEAALKAYTEAGALVAAANGNNAGPVSYPGKSQYVWGVASLDQNLVISSFSNWGPETDACAGGRDMVSSIPGGGYGSASGTSMASPVWAGLVAVMRGVYGKAALPTTAHINRYYAKVAAKVGNGDVQRYGPGYAYVRAILDTAPDAPGGSDPPPPPPPPPADPPQAVQSYVVETGGFLFRWRRQGETAWSVLKVQELHYTAKLEGTPAGAYDALAQEVAGYYANWSTELTTSMDWRDATYWAGQFLEYVSRYNNRPVQVTKLVGVDEQGRVHVVEVFDRADTEMLQLGGAVGTRAILLEAGKTYRDR